VDAALAALEGTALAQALRVSRWGCAAVNAGHVLGVALLVGAIVPLNLRLLGLWRGVPREPLVRARLAARRGRQPSPASPDILPRKQNFM